MSEERIFLAFVTRSFPHSKLDVSERSSRCAEAMSTMPSAVAVLKEATHGPNFRSRTNSSKGYYKRNGELIAIPHPVPMSSAELTARSAARGNISR